MVKPVVALVGRPNVGKSTLNRLAGERLAVVDDRPGTTRDRLVAECQWRGRTFDIVDTGGIDPSALQSQEPLSLDSADYVPQIREAEMAVADANAVILLVDAEAGVTPADQEVAGILRRATPRAGARRPPILLAVNKCDNAERRGAISEFYELGMGDPVPVSSLHGIGTGDLLDRLTDELQPPVAPELEAEGRSSHRDLLADPMSASPACSTACLAKSGFWCHQFQEPRVTPSTPT